MKKVKVKLKDIHIEENSIHNARWVVKDTFQCWLSKDELAKIYLAKKNNREYRKRLKRRIKQTKT